MTQAISNENMATFEFLKELDNSTFYPKESIAKGKEYLRDLCRAIESSQPKTIQDLTELTQKTTQDFNLLEEELNEEGCIIDTVAREAIAMAIGCISEAYGFEQVDIEQLIANREW
ncbi:hypothetical protein THRCLA_22189 [Thraustotheca clavata]|uniref:Uncharacterized protein n=1 Tax=Thraustotheca clavata TaxID=74557 RepID=A0A1V9ZAF3_9STRA|nr:hypothetical protein THRCLA_22189 [Thraustotheca clavata]